MARAAMASSKVQIGKDKEVDLLIDDEDGYTKFEGWMGGACTNCAMMNKELSMEQSTYDPCLLYSNQPFGIVGLQTDDTLFVTDDHFAEQEQL